MGTAQTAKLTPCIINHKPSSFESWSLPHCLYQIWRLIHGFPSRLFLPRQLHQPSLLLSGSARSIPVSPPRPGRGRWWRSREEAEDQLARHSQEIDEERQGHLLLKAAQIWLWWRELLEELRRWPVEQVINQLLSRLSTWNLKEKLCICWILMRCKVPSFSLKK